jgi:hypothetical protein
MNIAGVVILYHPDIQLLSENIKTYVQVLKQLYVYDNSETKLPGIEEALAKGAGDLDKLIRGKETWEII